MPRPRQTLSIPVNLKFEILKGEAFMRVRQAAKLAGLHPAILEMGQRLLQHAEAEAGVFQLATPEMKAKGDAIEEAFVKGLRRVARALGQNVNVRSVREGDRLTFWYAVKLGRAKKA